MNLKIALIFFSVILFIPSYAQSQTNPSLLLQTLEIPFYEFNRIVRESEINQLENEHSISWQVRVDNNLLYGNPDGNAVIRFYDSTVKDKFIEMGMGSPPNEKFWVALQLPDIGYVVVHSDPAQGWDSGFTPLIAYTEKAGLTVNNGLRIVISNLDVENFQIGSYSVHGMESSTDPPAVSSGSLILEFLSGDPSQNPIHLFPFFLAISVGILVATLLIFKKRS